jgi:hypothetical protein
VVGGTHGQTGDGAGEEAAEDGGVLARGGAVERAQAGEERAGGGEEEGGAGEVAPDVNRLIVQVEEAGGSAGWTIED